MNQHDSQTALDYFTHTPHAGQIDYAADNTAMLGDPAQGMVFALALAIDHGQIKQATFQAYGGTALIASGEYLCQQIENKSIMGLSPPTAEALRQALDLPRGAIGAMVLVVQTLKRILSQWEDKHGNR